MFASLFQSSKRRKQSPREERSPFSSPYTSAASPLATRRGLASQRRRPAADYDDPEEEEDDDDDAEEDTRLLENVDEEDEDEVGEDDEDEDEHGLGDTTPLLPIFSAAHLDALPIYSLTHSIRLIVVSRCETTLTWDQLRSPQVSQFLLKPIQQQIRNSHFTRATEYALMANCLQFTKEIGMNPGMSGTNKTRAMVCELLAMRLLKEYTTRELIDALAYDYYPLQGQDPPLSATAGPANRIDASVRKQPRAARISCLEVAIRASAKRFLAHPLVVQQLEAIWAGSVVFHSAADNLHRVPAKIVPKQNPGYGSLGNNERTFETSPSKLQPAKQRDHLAPVEVIVRRSVTLYNPKDASLFKLSRLRVPRYRNILSTLSFAVLLALFVSVLVERSLDITPLEVVFWIWSAGYMLDEVVGFNEQGFSLYLASFWNTFDLGILLVLIIHLLLRIYGIVMPDTRKHFVANMAYDVLAADAVLLFPRLFSVLDHYRYFSQLLIAFRMMAIDFAAIFILVIVACSGFFVALTLSFGNDTIDQPQNVAYVMLQLLMGFTPAAWDRWDGYNALGQTILTLFMFITHFLVVTILITVLTNSFMSIVQNANEEHQFVFAVNTISMVKSDSLFSYVAPTNILGWIITPLRYFLPFRRYVKLNRTVIKVTHFPILFSIFVYEKTILTSSVYEPTDLVEERGRSAQPKQESVAMRLFSPRPRRLVREPSIATYQKDRVLDEVFRQPFKDTGRKVQASQERRKTSNVVNTWMNEIGDNDILSPPQEQDQSIVERLEARKATLRMRRSQNFRNRRDFTDRSVASDPADFASHVDFLATPRPRFAENEATPSPGIDAAQQTDADGDDELVTNDNDDDEKMTSDRQPSVANPDDTAGLSTTVHGIDYFSRPGSRPKTPELSTSQSSKGGRTRFLSPATASRPVSRRHSPTRGTAHRRPHHLRNISTATILYNPVSEPSEGKRSSSESRPLSPTHAPDTARKSTSARNSAGLRSGAMTPASGSNLNITAGRHTPKRQQTQPDTATKARPIMPNASNPAFRSVPNFAAIMPSHRDRNGRPAMAGRRQSSGLMDLGSDIGDNKAIGGGWLGGLPGAIPGSFTTQADKWIRNANPANRDLNHGRSRGGGGKQYAGRRHSADETNDDGSDPDENGHSTRDEQVGLFGRLMLARMNNLESGFRDVVTEMRDHLKREERSDAASYDSKPGSGKMSRVQSTKKGKEREIFEEKPKEHKPQSRPVIGRRRSGAKAPRSKGNSEVGAGGKINSSEWVDVDDGGNGMGFQGPSSL